ncbi:ubiquitin carboxyl-terminal hydrolase-domain-containing protein [Talaromyces proteolyticus]|uniref:ubiquitinyl hydrolase 1 n=1 Tax=Talaromyces proteolyticus TaxID=1131652 RepID=A0AAD4L282_9EURO|nr:ubiquitin carboxyl-terminal hydrolase-domain-containing protein [Talaromyces proteolyticus]KAH8702495.1 ubiquitin carboxyl-terminal hydrolase-domain-containing protein [Talaromyces proteolyticus]
MSGIQRFLTKRGEKHRRARKQDKEIPSLGVRNHLRGLFVSSEPSSNLDKDEEKKLKTLEKKIAAIGIPDLKSEQLHGALTSAYAQGDIDKAFELLLIVEDSIEGILRDYSSRTKLVGAENRNGVTCYLDSLLFAMFARLDFFEAILYKSFTDDSDPRRKLVIILRMWVNMLRSGKLITTDITEHLQQSLSDCGWQDAAKLRQQDASEAFTFITEKLELPLLTLKMDIYHTGKEDTLDDHKFVNERLLEVAIPPEHTDGTPITLEECLETYFNNKIEVKRYMGRRGTVSSMRSFDSATKGGAIHVESIEIGSSTSSPVMTNFPQVNSPINEEASIPPILPRRPSIVQERFIPNQDPQDSLVHPSRRRKGSYRKEVMMPAWQFFSLIPWYTDNTPTNDAQVAAHFSSKRPILGICLKRYSVLPNGSAIRLNTFIDIPTQIGLPHFIQDDRLDEMGPLYGNFKLLLQSVVCHRGNSVDSGHYIALVRGTNSNSTPPASSESDSNSPAASQETEPWMRFDDLATERVTLVNIEQALKEESPYLLFYQIVPIDDNGLTEVQNENRTLFADPEDLENHAQKHLSVIGSVGEVPSDASISASVRPSLEITVPDGASNAEQEVSFKETTDDAENSGLRPSTAGRSGTSTDRRSLSLPRRRSKDTSSRSRSRGADQAEKRLSAALRFTLRLNKDKGSENQAESADDEDDNDWSLVTPPKGSEVQQSKQERDPESKRDGKQRQKQPHDKKDRNNPERECSVM